MLFLLILAGSLSVQSDSVQIITRDIPNFWRAYDQAAGKDSSERVRILETEYLQPGSPGLRDWIRVRLINPDTVRARLAAAGWPEAPLGSLPPDSVKQVTAPVYARPRAEQVLHA